jgi:hypothetical protein
MMRHDQIYGPIRSSLEHSLTALGPEAPSHRRLTLTREFLVFLEEEFETLAEKWEKRKAELEA